MRTFLFLLVTKALAASVLTAMGVT